MIIGAVLQASSYTRAQMIVGRVVSGVGMGIINSTVPVIQAEFSPKSSRGICKYLFSSKSPDFHLQVFSHILALFVCEFSQPCTIC